MARSPWILVIDRHITLCVLGGGCTLKEAAIVMSVLAKVKVPPKFQFSRLHLNPLHNMHVIVSSVKHGPPLEEGLLHDALAESHAATPRR